MESKTAASSHTCYCHLTSSEKDLRLRNLHHSLRISSQQVTALKAKFAKLIEAHSVSLHERDTSDIASVIADMTPTVEREFPEHSPQRIFWDQQVKVCTGDASAQSLQCLLSYMHACVYTGAVQQSQGQASDEVAPLHY